jgi:hypothetical protein
MASSEIDEKPHCGTDEERVMDELRHRIATEVLRVVGTGTQAEQVADRILAIPEIAEGLALRRNFHTQIANPPA